MERIGIEDARLNFADLIKKVEAGEEFILTRYGKDVAQLGIPYTDGNAKIEKFYSLLDQLKAKQKSSITNNEIKQWIEEGRA
ncbi:hypothetical protein K8I31_16380 [bacterium]|nr:hypothetical protein [bacterium]